MRIGEEVILIRGNAWRGPESGPGFGREVKARYLGSDGEVVECMLLEDDPHAVTAPIKAGEIGWWHGRSFIRSLQTSSVGSHAE